MDFAAQSTILWLAGCGRRNELQLWLSGGDAHRLLRTLPPQQQLDEYMAAINKRQRSLVDAVT